MVFNRIFDKLLSNISVVILVFELVGDIGGTKTQLAIFSSEKGPDNSIIKQTFVSNKYASLETLVKEFLTKVSYPVDRACFAVAGPVINGQSTITNLPWKIDEKILEKELSIRKVKLLNDLESVAYNIPHLKPTELYTLNSGHPIPHGNIVVIAPGTGLGEAYLTWNGTRYQAHATEGGHSDFAPTSTLQLELLRFLLNRYEHISFERVCSGIGIKNIYEFLKLSGHAQEPQWLKERLANVDDPVPIIMNKALEGKGQSELCDSTLDMFISILGSETSNFALKIMATNGVYLGGGIPPKILPALKESRFMKEFAKKGRMSSVVLGMPVHVILNADCGLIGAATYGFEELQ